MRHVKILLEMSFADGVQYFFKSLKLSDSTTSSGILFATKWPITENRTGVNKLNTQPIKVKHLGGDYFDVADILLLETTTAYG